MNMVLEAMKVMIRLVMIMLLLILFMRKKEGGGWGEGGRDGQAVSPVLTFHETPFYYVDRNTKRFQLVHIP